MALTNDQLREAMLIIQDHLESIEGVVGPDYRLTLVARYVGRKPLDADILMSLDDDDSVIAVINKMKGRAPRFAPEVGAK